MSASKKVVTVERQEDKVVLTCILETCPSSDCRMEFTLAQWQDLERRFLKGELHYE